MRGLSLLVACTLLPPLFANALKAFHPTVKHPALREDAMIRGLLNTRQVPSCPVAFSLCSGTSQCCPVGANCCIDNTCCVGGLICCNGAIPGCCLKGSSCCNGNKALGCCSAEQVCCADGSCCESSQYCVAASNGTISCCPNGEICLGGSTNTESFVTQTIPLSVLSTSQSSSSTSQDSIITSSTAAATPASSPKSTSLSPSTRLAIILGSILGVLGFLIVLCALWYFFGRRKRATLQLSTTGGTLLVPSEELTNALNPSMSAIDDGTEITPFPSSSHPDFQRGFQNGIGSSSKVVDGRVPVENPPSYVQSMASGLHSSIALTAPATSPLRAQRASSPNTQGGPVKSP